MHTVAYIDMQKKQLNKSFLKGFFLIVGHGGALFFFFLVVHTFKPSIKFHKQISVTL